MREVGNAPAGQPLELPARLDFPFRAIGQIGIDEYKSYSEAMLVEYLDWDKFAAHGVRGGIIQFTLPAFNAAGDAAVVYMSRGCGNLCAEGSLLYLERKSSRWVVVRSILIWIA